MQRVYLTFCHPMDDSRKVTHSYRYGEGCEFDLSIIGHEFQITRPNGRNTFRQFFHLDFVKVEIR